MIFVIGFFVILKIMHIVLYYSEFYLELKRIEVELFRSTGKERRYWKRQRRRLLVSFYLLFQHEFD